MPLNPSQLDAMRLFARCVLRPVLVRVLEKLAYVLCGGGFEHQAAGVVGEHFAA
jgi:hypothetical protein